MLHYAWPEQGGRGLPSLTPLVKRPPRAGGIWTGGWPPPIFLLGVPEICITKNKKYLFHFILIAYYLLPIAHLIPTYKNTSPLKIKNTYLTLYLFYFILIEQFGANL